MTAVPDRSHLAAFLAEFAGDPQEGHLCFFSHPALPEDRTQSVVTRL